MSALSPGQRVRVALGGGSQRGLLLTISEATAEVELDEGAEDIVAPLSALRDLEPFELYDPEDGPAAERAERWKMEGNQLFTELRDYAAAIERYLLAWRALQADARLTPGSHVLVKGAGTSETGGRSRRDHAAATSETGGVRRALVLTVDAKRAEVAYEQCTASRVRAEGGGLREQLAALQRLAAEIEEEGAAGGGGAEAREEGEDEEEEVHTDRLIRVHAELAALQMALLLNMARCNLAQKARQHEMNRRD